MRVLRVSSAVIDPSVNTSHREPELVRSLRLHSLFAFLASLDVLFNGGQNFAIERAIVLLCYCSGLFQQMDREPNGQRFDHLFHIAILTLIKLHVKGLTPLPKPQTRNVPSIPMAKARGFTARSDKVLFSVKGGV